MCFNFAHESQVTLGTSRRSDGQASSLQSLEASKSGMGEHDQSASFHSFIIKQRKRNSNRNRNSIVLSGIKNCRS